MSLRRTLLGSLLAGLSLSTPVWSVPQGGQVQSGTVQIQGVPGGLNLQQLSDRAIINWNSFNIDVNEIVRIMQPGAAAVLLNRVVGQDPSVILGQLQANGQVWLVNPNGILFGPNAKVDVAGLLATTLKVNDGDFLRGRAEFAQDPSRPLAAVINQGTIRVSDGGHLILVAPLVSNEGVLVAHLGQVVMGAGEGASVSFDPGGLIQYQLSAPVGAAGPVVLTPDMVSDVLRQVVQHKGVGEAGELVQQNGQWQLLAGSGTALQAGRIDAAGGHVVVDSTAHTVATSASVSDVSSSTGVGGELKILSQGSLWAQTGSSLLARGGPGSQGGFVEVSAPRLSLGSQVDTRSDGGKAGTFLIDPANIQIVDGGEGTGGGNVPGSAPATDPDGTTTTLGKQYLQEQNTNISLEATNSIFIQGSDALSLEGGNSLTLHAITGSISVNPGMTGPTLLRTSNGDITLTAGQNITVGGLVTQTGNIVLDAGSSISVLGSTSSSGGNNMTFTAGTSIDIAGQTSLQTVGPTGNFTLTAGANITQGENSGLSSDNGNLSLNAGGDLTTSGLNTLTGYNGSVLLTAGNNLQLGSFNTVRSSPTGSISLTATNGNVLLAPNVSLGDPEALQGGGLGALSITAGGSVLPTADDVSPTSNGLNGSSVTIQAGGEINLPMGVQANNSISLEAGTNSALAGGLQAAQLVSGGTASLTARESMTLFQGASTQGALTATATNGNLVVAPGSSLSATGGAISLSAGQDIEVGSMNTSAGNIGVTAGHSIFVQPSSSISSFGAMDLTANTGEINIGDGSNLQTTSPTGNFTLTAGGNIVLNANSSVASDNGSLTLNAGADLVAMSQTVLTAYSGSVGLIATNNVQLGSFSLVRSSAAGSIGVTATNGDVRLAPNVSLGDPEALAGGGLGALSITAGGSVVSTNDDVSPTSNALNGSTVTVQAGGDITLPMGVQANTSINLDAGRNPAAPSGNLQTAQLSSGGTTTLHARDNLTTTRDVSSSGNLALTADVGDVDVVQALQGNAGVSIQAGRDVELEATVQGNSITLGAGRDVTNQTLLATNDINVTAGRDVDLHNQMSSFGGGAIHLTAGNSIVENAPGFGSLRAPVITLRATAGDINLAGPIGPTGPTAIPGDLVAVAGGSVTLGAVSATRLAGRAGGSFSVTTGDPISLTLTTLSLPGATGPAESVSGVQASNVVLSAGGNLTLGDSSLAGTPGVRATSSATLVARSGNIVAGNGTPVDVDSPTASFSANAGAGSVGSLDVPVRVYSTQTHTADTTTSSTFFQEITPPPPPPDPPPPPPPVVVDPTPAPPTPSDPVQPPSPVPSPEPPVTPSDPIVTPTAAATPPPESQEVGNGLGFLPGNLTDGGAVTNSAGSGSANGGSSNNDSLITTESEGEKPATQGSVAQQIPQFASEPRPDAPLQSPVLLSFELDQLMSLPLSSPYLELTLDNLMDESVMSPYLELTLDNLLTEPLDSGSGGTSEPASGEKPSGGPAPTVGQIVPTEGTAGRIDTPLQSPALLSYDLDQLMSLPLTSLYLEQTIDKLMDEPVRSPYLDLTLDTLLTQPVDAEGPDPVVSRNPQP